MEESGGAALMELRVRNVQEAYVRGLHTLATHGVSEDSRNGPVLVLPEPMVTVYDRPLERVMLDPSRDANPFFHLLESFWMLAGRRDVASLEPFNAGLKRYSDDGEDYHGAYGWRWRNHFTQTKSVGVLQVGYPLDQLRRAIELLRANPADRRVVIAMWDPEVDLGQEGLDFPCNTHIYFRTRQDSTDAMRQGRPDHTTMLDMTVCCRSNDAVWGAYGANAVHFSVLQEFVAAACGFGLGRMVQLSNNFHVYKDVLAKVGMPTWPYKLEGKVEFAEGGISATYETGHCTAYEDPCPDLRTRTVPLFRTDATTDLDVVLETIEYFWDDELDGAAHEAVCAEGASQFTSEGLMLLTDVRNAYLCFKGKDRAAARAHVADMPEGSDWRRACGEWLERRYADR